MANIITIFQIITHIIKNKICSLVTAIIDSLILVFVFHLLSTEGVLIYGIKMDCIGLKHQLVMLLFD
jgi:hypothetical protein